MNALRRWWQALLTVFRHKRQPQISSPELPPNPPLPPPWLVRSHLPTEPTAPDPETNPAPAEPTKKARQPTDPNRALRRKLERERRKYDRFVEPKGKAPKRSRRQGIIPDPVPKPDPEPEPPAVPDALNGLILSGQHPYASEADTKKDVLYEPSEFMGQFNFRDTILDQLERYFYYLHRMRRRDPQTYNLYRQIGGHLIPLGAIGVFEPARERIREEFEHYHYSEEDVKEMAGIELSPSFLAFRPAFGCVAIGANPVAEAQEIVPIKKDRLWIPKFIYFVKYSRPPATLEPTTGGDVYTMTIWWDIPASDPRAKVWKHGVPQEFGVYVSADGKHVRALKDLGPQHHRRHYDGGWKLPHAFAHWARDRHCDPQIFLRYLFISSVRFCEEPYYSMVRVAVSKEKETAVFGVNEHRLSYFFCDRDVTVNQNGTRTPIFHVVRPHTRHIGTREVDIKMHFRGERKFTWAGYDVMISVPGKHHLSLVDFDIPCIDEEWAEPGVKYIDHGELGKMLADYLPH